MCLQIITRKMLYLTAGTLAGRPMDGGQRWRKRRLELEEVSAPLEPSSQASRRAKDAGGKVVNRTGAASWFRSLPHWDETRTPPEERYGITEELSEHQSEAKLKIGHAGFLRRTGPAVHMQTRT